MSNYPLHIIKDNNFSLGKNEKFIPNLSNKRKYKLHYQNLKQRVRITIKKTINRVLQLKQSPFLKPYFECNRRLKKEIEKIGNKVKKQNARLRNNVIFGKSIES